MCSKKSTTKNALGYILKDDRKFDDLESNSNVDEIDATEYNSYKVGANFTIDDNGLYNLDQNKDSDIPENDDELLSNVPVISKDEKEKQPQEYRWCKINIDAMENRFQTCYLKY